MGERGRGRLPRPSRPFLPGALGSSQTRASSWGSAGWGRGRGRAHSPTPGACTQQDAHSRGPSELYWAGLWRPPLGGCTSTRSRAGSCSAGGHHTLVTEKRRKCLRRAAWNRVGPYSGRRGPQQRQVPLRLQQPAAQQPLPQAGLHRLPLPRHPRE